MYAVPEEYFFRIHHVRPRFKNDVESVLLYVAQECTRLSDLPMRDYAELLNRAIRLYGGNLSLADKTINNWRTEIAALFGFYIEDKQVDITKTGDIARLLATNQDLIEFFKYYLYYFQYPGGHLKQDKVKEFIEAGVKFKPAQYILKVLIAGNDEKAHFSLNKAEATHCIFNDLRVTRDNRDPKEVVKLILSNRTAKIEYDSSGDVTRYAGDILDYMVLANLLKESHGYYYINGGELEAINAFISSSDYFKGYDEFYGNPNIDLTAIRLVEPQWFEYVNNKLSSDLFATNIAQFIGETISEYSDIVDDRIKQIITDSQHSTKDIGDIGESLVISHEKARITQCGLGDLPHLIQKIPTSLGVGYDIQSLEGTPDRIKRYIEVKTTISQNRLNFGNFHLTPNEWNSATTLRDRYYVYRLMINKDERTLYILQDPVSLYKQDKIFMSLSHKSGAEISFPETACTKTALML